MSHEEGFEEIGDIASQIVAVKGGLCSEYQNCLSFPTLECTQSDETEVIIIFLFNGQNEVMKSYKEHQAAKANYNMLYNEMMRRNVIDEARKEIAVA